MKILPVSLIAAAAMLAVGTASAQTMAPGNPAPAGASGNSNPAINTNHDNVAAPAKGANSFTQSEAQKRLEAHGFSNVSDLNKDADGIWRGTAQHGDQSANVWVDYKGNVGQQ